MIGSLSRRAGREDTGGDFVVCEDSLRAFDGEFRIAAKVAFGKTDMPKPGGVVIAEPVAKIISSAVELRLGGDRFDLAGVRSNAEVAAGDIDSSPGFLRFDETAAITIGNMDPAVQAPFKTVDTVLLVSGLEAGEEDLSFVGATIAIRVFGVEDIRGGGDEDPVSPGHDPGGEGDVIKEDRGSFVAAVAVVIL